MPRKAEIQVDIGFGNIHPTLLRNGCYRHPFIVAFLHRTFYYLSPYECSSDRILRSWVCMCGFSVRFTSGHPNSVSFRRKQWKQNGDFPSSTLPTQLPEEWHWNRGDVHDYYDRVQWVDDNKHSNGTERHSINTTTPRVAFWCAGRLWTMLSRYEEVLCTTAQRFNICLLK